MTELTDSQMINLLQLNIDSFIKYKDESYKVIRKSSSPYGDFIYIEKTPDDGKKYNLCLTKSKQLSFHVLGYLTISIPYSDISI